MRARAAEDFDGIFDEQTTNELHPGVQHRRDAAREAMPWRPRDPRARVRRHSARSNPSFGFGFFPRPRRAPRLEPRARAQIASGDPGGAVTPGFDASLPATECPGGRDVLAGQEDDRSLDGLLHGRGRSGRCRCLSRLQVFPRCSRGRARSTPRRASLRSDRSSGGRCI